MKPYLNHKDFLQDELFIYWRTQPSKELDAFWAKFIQKNEHLRQSFDEAVKSFDVIQNEQGGTRLDENLLFNRLQDRIRKEKKQRRARAFFVSSAASVLLILLTTTIFIQDRHEEARVPEMSTIGKAVSENNIQLLSGNNVLALNNNSELNLTGNRAIIQDSLSRQEVDLQKEQVNKLIVPFGKRSSILLSDGSKVYLNSGTEMEFPVSFTGLTREINVTGEVFVEIASEEKPFIIHTPRSQITVYGTSFNISSYTDEESESVVLVSGSVEVASMNGSLKLKPNEMAEIRNGSIHQRQVDVTEYISWKNGYLELNKTPLNEVLMKIGRYYNMEFTYHTELDLDNRTCSGKLYLSDNFDNVLESFSKMTYLDHERMNDKTIAIVQRE